MARAAGPLFAPRRDVPRRIVDVFRQILAGPTLEDAAHHYDALECTLSIGEGYFRRVDRRRGSRIAPGVSHFLDVEVGSAIPLGESVTRSWTAKDLRTKRRLRTEVTNEPDAYRKLWRLWFQDAIAQHGSFDLQTTFEVPTVEIDGVGCAGLKLRGYRRKIDRVRVSLEFDSAPVDVKCFEWNGREVLLSPLAMKRSGRATAGSALYELEIAEVKDCQLLLAWFRDDTTNSTIRLLKAARVPALRILFAAANPLDTVALDIEQEISELDRELDGVRFRDDVELSYALALRPDDLVRSLRKHRPNILHFSGHGSPSGIILRANGGKTHHVPAATLRRVLANRGIEVVVLNACYTGRQAGAIGKSVPIVVGASRQVNDEAAATFSVAFYRALGNGLSVGEAFRDAKDEVLLHGFKDSFLATGNLDKVFVAASP